MRFDSEGKWNKMQRHLTKRKGAGERERGGRAFAFLSTQEGKSLVSVSVGWISTRGNNLILFFFLCPFPTPDVCVLLLLLVYRLETDWRGRNEIQRAAPLINRAQSCKKAFV